MPLPNFLRRLNEPFPEKKGFKENVTNAAWIGVFIACFLFFFRPFGFSAVDNQIFWIAFVFGFITFGVTVLVDVVTRFILKFKRDTDSWTLGRWILDTITLVFFIAVGNYLYFVYLSESAHSWDSFLQMLISTYVIGLFPIVLSGLLIQIKASKKNQSEAQQIQENLMTVSEEEKEDLLHLSGQNEGQVLEITPSDFLFAEALSNYVSVCYRDSGEIKYTKLRNTIQTIEDEIQDEMIMRCHRSFLVNAQQIAQVEGNAQGLRLQLKSLDQPIIPVSRSFVKKMREQLSYQ